MNDFLGFLGLALFIILVFKGCQHEPLVGCHGTVWSTCIEERVE